MKHIKGYKLFKEDLDDLEVLDTDEGDVRMSKEKLNDMKAYISEYNSKKSSIDSLYKSENNPDELSKKLEAILGKESEERNPFLIDYSNIASMNKKIQDLQKKSDDKAIEISNFKDRLSLTEDPGSRTALFDKVKEIEKQISDNKLDIADKMKKVPEMEKELSERLKKNEVDIKNWIEKIQ